MPLLAKIPNSLREAGVYGAAFGISRLSGILLLPLLTNRLSDGELGVFGLLTSTTLLLQFLSGLGLDSGATRWFYEAQALGLRDAELRDDRRRTLATWVWATLLISVGLSSIGIVLAGPIAHTLFDGSGHHVAAVRASALTIPALAMINVLQHWYRMVRRPLPAFVIAVLVAAGTLTLTVVLVAIRDYGIVGVFGAQASVGTVATVIGLRQMWPEIGLSNVDRVRLKRMLTYSLPLLPALASPFLVGLLIRVLIRVLSNVDEVGKFQVVSMISTVVVVLTTAVQQAWEPFSLSIPDRLGAKPIYRAMLFFYAVLVGFIVVALAGLLPLVLPILGQRFVALAVPTVVFSASVLISGAFPIINTGPSIAGTGRPALEAMVSGSLLSLVFCAVLVPGMGQRGASWAALIAAFVTVFVGLYRSERSWHVGYPLQEVGVAVVGGAAIAAFAYELGHRSNISVFGRAVGVGLLLALFAAVAGSRIARLFQVLRSHAA